MVQAKDESPSVATFADHEVITPPHKLRKAVRQALPGEEDPVARAEAALAQLEGEFSDWMHAECERLDSRAPRHSCPWIYRQDARSGVPRRP